MMRSASTLDPASKPSARTPYDRLRETVLSGHAAFFQTVLADALDKDFADVRDVSEDPSYAWLLDALRLLDVGDEKAFLVTAALYPSLFGDLAGDPPLPAALCRDQPRGSSAARRSLEVRVERSSIRLVEKPFPRYPDCRLTELRARRPR